VKTGVADKIELWAGNCAQGINLECSGEEMVVGQLHCPIYQLEI
jgi:hypothetical protein